MLLIGFLRVGIFSNWCSLVVEILLNKEFMLHFFVTLSNLLDLSLEYSLGILINFIFIDQKKTLHIERANLMITTTYAHVL